MESHLPRPDSNMTNVYTCFYRLPLHGLFLWKNNRRFKKKNEYILIEIPVQNMLSNFVRQNSAQAKGIRSSFSLRFKVKNGKGQIIGSWEKWVFGTFYMSSSVPHYDKGYNFSLTSISPPCFWFLKTQPHRCKKKTINVQHLYFSPLSMSPSSQTIVDWSFPLEPAKLKCSSFTTCKLRNSPLGTQKAQMF